jgi:hypothetical protein
MQEQQQLQAMRGTAFNAQGSQRDRAAQEMLTQRSIPMAEQQQVYNQQSGLFGLNQAARQRGIEESAYLRNMPLNETAALMSGNQINNPQFSAAPNTGIANTDYAGLVQNNYNAQVNAANAAAASRSGTAGAFLGMAGKLGAAYISDRRVKQNISKVGTLDNGLPVYSFQYKWGGPQQIGLMAQDVEKVNPAAVTEIDGIKAVYYSEAVK